MSKKLSYKILAAVLALNAFNLAAAAPAWAADDLKGDETGKHATVEDGKEYRNVYGTYSLGSDASEGKVTFNNGSASKVYGGYTLKNDATSNRVIINDGIIATSVYCGYSVGGNATDNSVEIKGGTVRGGISGGYTGNGVAKNNSIIINGGTIGGNISGGYSKNGDAEDNNVIINGGTTDDVYGGFSTSGNVKNNTVTINGGKLTDTIYGGYISFGKNSDIEISNNRIILQNEADVSSVDLYGGYDKNNNATIKNNSLMLNAWSGSAKSAKNFDAISFENVKWDTTTPVLTLTSAAENDLANTEIDIVSFDKNTEIKPGESMTFVKSSTDVNLGIQQINVRKTALQGLAKEITGIMESTNDGTAYTFTIEKIGVNPQTNLLTQTNAAAAAFVNQGTDLINDSLDVIGRDGTYGVKTFAAVQGNRSKYDVADDLKINGWSVIAGFGAENEHNGGDFAWGVFYENGSGNYRTYNHFNNEFFRGDGSMVYNGGGVAARYENSHGVYTEGSLRAGMLKNEMDNALRDANGSYGCDTESAYYGAHIGVGQIFTISESSDLDVYGKFFHTYTEGDTVMIAGDKFDFDSITSDRLRVGARVTTNKANAFSAYYGLAYEYEFNGDADMTAQGIKAPTESFGGSSCMAELGLNYQPTPDSPWNFDLNLRGYAGERKGGSFNVQATYTF